MKAALVNQKDKSVSIPNRRVFLRGATASVALTGLTPGLVHNAFAAQNALAAKGAPLITKPIPSTGEVIPVIGMGTWITFNVGRNIDARNARTDVLKTFFDLGGTMVDSSPMYGAAEDVMGYALKQLTAEGAKPLSSLFSATKVWTRGDGEQQIADSFRLWGIDEFDLFQIHNLLNWQDHLAELRQLKADGKIRYIGITTSHGRRHKDLEDIMKTEALDFLQLTYNMQYRDVEQRLLPLAKEKGIAVIANRPQDGGRLFDAVGDKPLPQWAAEIGCANWAQFFLKFVVSHPAMTCAIPATSQIAHMQENMGAARGVLPDEKTRAKMLSYFQTL